MVTVLYSKGRKEELLDVRGDFIDTMDKSCIMVKNIQDLDEKLENGFYPYKTNKDKFVINKCLENHIPCLWQPGEKVSANPCCNFDLNKVPRNQLSEDHQKLLDVLLIQKRKCGGKKRRKTKMKHRRKRTRKSHKKRSFTSNRI
jgi:hypothetical protein